MGLQGVVPRMRHYGNRFQNSTAKKLVTLKGVVKSDNIKTYCNSKDNGIMTSGKVNAAADRIQKMTTRPDNKNRIP